ncbi:MAG: M23 family metallopeptidase [Candidatus Promineofilum sp.]|nr:M23 family metallopeptidase [Promineifilum sp.]
MDSEPSTSPDYAAQFAFPTAAEALARQGVVEVPAGWEVTLEAGDGDDDAAGPEGAFITERHIIPARAHLLGDDGWAYRLHSPGPYRARFTTRVALDAGEYDLSLAYFADWRYDFGDASLPPDQPDHAQVRFVVGRREVAWTTPEPLHHNRLDHVIRLDEPATLRLGFEVWSRYPATSNGFFLQAFTVRARSGLEAAGQHRVVVNLLPQDATLREKWHILFHTHAQRQALLQSHDDALTLVQSGRADSTIRLWGRERLDAGQQAAIAAAGVAVQDEPLTGIALQPPPPSGPEALSGVVINLLPQDATLMQKWHVLQTVHDGKQSLMQSHDDAYTLLELAGAGALLRLWGGASLLPEQTQRLQSLGVVMAPESYPPPRPVVAPPTGEFRFTHWPCTTTLIWQHFGENPDRYKEFKLPGHEGIDIEAPFGSPLFAVADGIVAENPSHASAYGVHVRINHPGDYQTIYAHMERPAVVPGQTVRGGDVIGYADSTGHVWPKPTPERPHDGSHLHLTLKAFNRATEYPYNIINPTPFLRALPQYPAGAAIIAPPPAPSAAPTYDLFDYLCGDGRLYEVGGSGGQERFQTQRDGHRFYIVKNANWEELWADADYIWRGFDTSPDNDRYYIQKEDGREGARWANRRMRVGETFRGFGHHVQFYFKRDCRRSDLNSGRATNQTTLVAHHDAMTWNNVTIHDVIELKGIGEERYFFARGFGMVGWRSPWGESGVAEVHALHARPDNVRLRIPCMSRD